MLETRAAVSSERSRGTRLRERGALLGVLAIVGIADAAGAVTAIFASDPEPGSCAAAEPAAVLVDASTPPIAGDPVAKYAPLVFFERQEAHLPMPADCFIEEAELSWARSSAAGAEVFEPVADIDDARLGGSEGGYSVDDGGVFRSHEFTRPFAQGRARLTDRRGFFLDVDDRFRYGGDPALAGIPAYYEFVPGRYVTYWLFYGFSAPAGTKSAVAGMLGHEGDWERITVRLDGTEAAEVAYYQHGAGPELVAYAAVEKRGTHPVAFSGRGSHASYRTAGFQAKFADRTGRAREWRTWEFIADATKQPWYGFGGAWGVVRSVPRTVRALGRRAGLPIGDGEFTGPSGPCSKKPAPDDWLLDAAVPPPGPGVCAPR